MSDEPLFAIERAEQRYREGAQRAADTYAALDEQIALVQRIGAVSGEETPVEEGMDNDGSLWFHVYGVERLPAGTVITFTVTIGPGGDVAVVPPVATPPAEAQKPKRYINGGG